MPATSLATQERASRMLRMFILLLMVLILLAAVYALALGGPPPPGDVMFFRTGGPGVVGSGPIGLEVPPPPVPGAVGREVQETCNIRDGVRTCTRTERDLRPGDQLHAPPPATPVQPAAPLQHSGLIKAGFLIPADSGEGHSTQAFAGSASGAEPVPFNLPVRAIGIGPGGGAAELALALLALLFLLGTLFNIERLLLAFEKGAVFAETTVRRLQHTGIFVAALGFLPQIDIFALLRNVVLSLVTEAPVGPLPVAGGGINVALILAGVFTVLIARIVHEANALAEDVRGTV
ncbi:MAG: DUF2975 domain-containing protein [Alphaproteobacteria bacterium]|nr:DUF2975 domain-containing protein [Alphaproteobacteria bacterium]MBL6937392.1 DUF2975 domain-containing protein [Alphaproteobacteria bacterium]MBL7096046.1 DUF2975 domain-containing protein [Alphaproteobacteria bacterium]